ncbi:MAG TPA: cupin domain-containing protein [Dehalococcoidia bacterium]|jgi:mannose-6-phosphate isomerase-like protein (cupin superfamily)
MPEPIILPPPSERADPAAAVEAHGAGLVIAEWGGAYVGYVAPLHVHHGDDEAWHVLAGSMRFRLGDREVVAVAGTTVMAPAGLPHTFGNAGPGAARYLIVTSTRLSDLIAELHQVDSSEHAAVFKKYDSELLETS